MPPDPPTDRGAAFSRLALVVPAAGRSSRMGRPKALIELDGRTLLEHLLSPAFLRRLGDVVVVLGHHGDQLRPLVERCRARLVVNPDPDRGRTGSVQEGLRALSDRIEAVFLQPVDCPLIRSETYRHLAEALTDEADVVIPAFKGQTGHPPLFSTRLTPGILAADPDRPLRELFRAKGVRRRTIQVDDPGVLLNIDRPEDLLALKHIYDRQRQEPAEER